MDLTGYLWIAGAVLLAAVLVLALVLVMLRRYRTPLEQRFVQLDREIAQHAPGLWRFVRQRFSLEAWHGLALTAAVALIFVATTAFAGVTESWQDREVLYQVDQQVVVLAGALSASTVEVFRWITYAGDFSRCSSSAFRWPRRCSGGGIAGGCWPSCWRRSAGRPCSG